MKLKWFPFLLSAFCLTPIVAIALLASGDFFRVKALPIMGTLPEFRLLDSKGTDATLDRFLGKIWIASFIFTRCSGQCPIVSSRIKYVEHELRHKTEVRFVSISVDPDYDTPDRLDRYALQLEANPLKWFFLTGNRMETKSLLKEGFKVVMEPTNSKEEAVMHTSKLVLVDPWGRIRGYFDANEMDEVKKLIKDTRRLIRQSY